MAHVLGKGTKIGAAREVTFGSPESRTLWFDVLSCDLREDTSWVPVEGLSDIESGPVGREMYASGADVRGTIRMYPTFEGFGFWLRQICGPAAVTTGASSPYSHAQGIADALTSATLELIRGSSGNSEVFNGVVVNRAVLTMEAGRLADLSVEVLGRASGGRSSAPTVSLASTRERRVSFAHAGTLAWNSTTRTCRRVTLTIDNKLAVRRELGSLYTLLPTRTGPAEVTLDLDLSYEDDALYTAHRAGTRSDASIAFTNGARSITIALNNTNVDTVSDPMSSWGGLTQTARLRAMADSTGEGLTVTTVNTQSSAEAA